MSTILITGASAGLGLLTSRVLAEQGQHVILAVRDVGRGEQAADRIRHDVPGATVEVLHCDLASLASVRRAAAAINARPDPVQVLIGNAGVQVVDGIARSADGFELTFATNHLGHALLTTSVLAGLHRPARIILVASEVHQGPRRSLGFPAPRWEEPRLLARPDRPGLSTSATAGRVRYANSKLANVMFGYELDRRFGGGDLTVNAFDPGLMPQTGLDRQYPPLVRRAYHGLSGLLTRLPGVRLVADSAADLAWLATSPEVSGVSGAYFSVRTAHPSSPFSYDRAAAAELFDQTMELVRA